MEKYCIIDPGAVNRISEFATKFYAKKAFLVGDRNTFPLAGIEIAKQLNACDIKTVTYVLKTDKLEPDEQAVGSLMLHYNAECDLIIGIGSGVINDLCKLLAHQTKNPFIMVATAPSMDGYASPLSSMLQDGLKVSIPTKRADIIVADLNIVKNAPMSMLKAGLGDMLAKYVAICEWRIGHLITGEAYDAEIANSVRQALRKCVEHADGLMNRDEDAVRSVFEGLILTGEAMKKAGVSRPASGAEHYFSHILDMRGLEFDAPVELHGLQCAIMTRLCIKIYQKLKHIIPDEELALHKAKSFDREKWNAQLRDFLGKAAEPMIALEVHEGKYDCDKHKKRLATIVANWNEIVKIIEEELPTEEEIDALFATVKMPLTIGGKDIRHDILAMTVNAGKDIRDKYVLPRLMWDLGVLDELCEDL